MTQVEMLRGELERTERAQAELRAMPQNAMRAGLIAQYDSRIRDINYQIARYVQLNPIA